MSPECGRIMGMIRISIPTLRYPIPLDPPYVPQENPCGAYVRTFEYQKKEDAPNVYLNFEGVDSCLYVWVNGTYVGYSQVSHASREFDITDLVKNGSNTLAVLVLKWCDGTYWKTRINFGMSGIFGMCICCSGLINAIYELFHNNQDCGWKRRNYLCGQST